MKFFVAFVLTAALAYAGGLYFDWWIIAIAAFLVAVAIPQKPFYAFLAAFLGIGLLWFALASIIDMQNEQLLSPKVAEIIFKKPSAWLIKLATGLVGGITGGLSGLTGAFLRRK